MADGIRSILHSIGLSEQASVRGLASLLSLPDGEIRVSNLVRQLTAFSRFTPAPLVLVEQNMALLPVAYKGTNRAAALGGLIRHLKELQPDVVGLTECFLNSEREDIRSELSTLFPASMSGPDEDDLEEDGGLLLLSRHHLLATHQTIFRHCIGEDCLTNKGALHVRIEVAGHPAPYDVFLSHTQNPDPLVTFPNSGPPDPVAVLESQLMQLAAFVHACGSPDRPSILLGDLNINGYNPDRYRLLTRALSSEGHYRPLDIWKAAGQGGDGATLARECNFYEDADDAPSQDERLDYMITWLDPHRENRPRFASAEVLRWTADSGRSLSDHYGLLCRQSHVLSLRTPPEAAIQSVEITLQAFRCLTVTDGAVPGLAGDDEVQFELRTRTAAGESHDRQTGIFEDVDAGSYRLLSEPPRLLSADPGEWIDIEVAGWEVNTVFGEVVDRDDLGRERVRVGRSHLLRLLGGSVRRTMPLLQGAGGQYAITVVIEVL